MNKMVLVSGATSGFGKEIAKIFAKNGYDVCITGRRKERLQELKIELEAAYKAKVIMLQFDVRNRQEVITAIDGLKKQINAVDILVNNAGLAAGLSTIDEGDMDDWDVMIDTNVKGLLYVTKQVLPLMKEKGGHIFNIGSTASKLVYKNGNVYCATKFAVDALSQSMRIDLLPYGIKVTAVHPGMAETEFSLVRFKGDAERASAVYRGFEPLHPEDIADTVYYCATLPKHVCINDLTMTCLNQATSMYTIKDSERVNLDK
ncbi:MAG: SDR family NAD(P)-dependent oxidoreductase [Bacteroidetes bacterium]|nr:SDR family NAD(P)-dependent oxidoreductase [Bacteroidota bacterium]